MRSDAVVDLLQPGLLPLPLGFDDFAEEALVDGVDDQRDRPRVVAGQLRLDQFRPVGEVDLQFFFEEPNRVDLLLEHRQCGDFRVAQGGGQDEVRAQHARPGS